MKTVKELFENIDVNFKPVPAYIYYLNSMKERGLEFPEIYLSSALTSGGYKRVPNLTPFEIINKNAELSAKIRELLYAHNLLDPNELIFFPADTVEFEDWGQYEYNFFFAMFVLGVVHEDDVVKMEEYVKNNIDMTGFINRDAPRDERAKSYEQLVVLLEKYIIEHNIAIKPVKKLIQLLDGTESLGSKMEAEIAKKFGAKIFKVKFRNNKGDAVGSDLEDIFQEITPLEELGADFFIEDSQSSEPIQLIES